MQFIRGGPNVPQKLIEACEDGQVVFFCGAGISCNAGLPLFEELVEAIGDDLGWGDTEQTHFDKEEYDICLNLMSKRVDRQELRENIWKNLQPKPRRKYATSLHHALLSLSKDKETGKTKLVTTNVDRIFEKYLKRSKKNPGPEALVSPRPPIPKKTYWDGIVYLHGLLPPVNYDNKYAIDNLIITSSDFGRAYLSERWAARFVTEMFKNFTVCFVGYSISDPVMRYIVDAMDADKSDGQDIKEQYIFIKEDDAKEWKDRGVMPIEYKLSNKHHLLCETFTKWAEDAADGFLAKSDTIKEIHKIKNIPNPGEYLKDNKEIGRVLWALNDLDVFRQFVGLKPRPSWDWVKVLSSDGFSLDGFDLFDSKTFFKKLPHLIIFKHDISEYQNQALRSYSYWISRYIDRPELALWLVQMGQEPSHVLIDCITRQLELPERRSDEAPKGDSANNDPVIYPVMRRFWKLYLTGQINLKINRSELRGMDVRKRIKASNLTHSIKLEIRDALKAKASIRGYGYGDGYERQLPTDDEIKKAEFINNLFYAEIDIDLGHGVEDFCEQACKDNISEDDKKFYRMVFQDALKGIFDLMEDVLGPRLTHWRIDTYLINLDDSARPRGQWQMVERPRDQWQIIAEGLNQLWHQLASKHPDDAKQIVHEWINEEHTYFRWFGVKYLINDMFSIDDVFDILDENDGSRMFDPATYRNARHLLLKRGKEFSEQHICKLEQYILNNSNGIAVEDDEHIHRNTIWFLDALKDAGITLSQQSRDYLKEYKNHKVLKLYFEKKPPQEKWPDNASSPEEWVAFLKKYPSDRSDVDFDDKGKSTIRHDPWRAYCERNPEKAFEILKTIPNTDLPADRWNWAMHSWDSAAKGSINRNEDENKDRYTKLISSIFEYLNSIDDAVFQKIANATASFINTMCPIILRIGGKEGSQFEDDVIDFISRAIKICSDEPSQITGDDNYIDIIHHAINWTVGKAAEIALQFQIIISPKYTDGLHEKIKPVFEQIMNNAGKTGNDGRAMLATRAVDLYLLDKEWAKTHIIPHFMSKDDQIKQAMWTGFLWSGGRWTPDFIELVSDELLTLHNKKWITAERYFEYYTSVVIDIYLADISVFTNPELQVCIRETESEYRKYFIYILCERMEVATNKTVFWQKKVKPFFDNVFPKDMSIKCNPNLGKYYLRIILSAEDEFEDALKTLGQYIKDDGDIYFLHRELGKLTVQKDGNAATDDNSDAAKTGFNYVEAFPKASLKLLGLLPLKESYMRDDTVNMLRDMLNIFRENNLHDTQDFIKIKDILDGK